jgi:hypothetical protein
VHLWELQWWLYYSNGTRKLIPQLLKQVVNTHYTSDVTEKWALRNTPPTRLVWRQTYRLNYWHHANSPGHSIPIVPAERIYLYAINTSRPAILHNKCASLLLYSSHFMLLKPHFTRLLKPRALVSANIFWWNLLVTRDRRSKHYRFTSLFLKNFPQ